MRLLVALFIAIISVTSVTAREQDQTVSVGPWTIAASFKAEKFDRCTMSRSANDLDTTFARSQDGFPVSRFIEMETRERQGVRCDAGCRCAISPGKSVGRSLERSDRFTGPPAQRESAHGQYSRSERRRNDTEGATRRKYGGP